MSQRRHVRPDDIVKLFNEFRGFRRFEVLAPVRLKPMRAPNPLHRTHRDARSLGHGRRGSMGCFAGRQALRQFNDAGFLRKRRLSRRPRLGLQKPIHTRLHEALLPTPDAGLRLGRSPHDLRRAATGASEENDVGLPNMLLRAVAAATIDSRRARSSAVTLKEIPVRMPRDSHNSHEHGILKRTLMLGLIHRIVPAGAKVLTKSVITEARDKEEPSEWLDSSSRFCVGKCGAPQNASDLPPADLHVPPPFH